jgi:hypothetical protein
MLLETVKLRGTKFNRVGAQSRITMLGLLGRAFSSGEDLPCQFGSNAGSPRLREQGRFLAEIAVYPRSPPLCFNSKWSNKGRIQLVYRWNFNLMAFCGGFYKKFKKKPVRRRTKTQIPVKQWPGLKK